MPLNFYPSGQIMPFSNAAIAAMGIETLGIEDGTHPQFSFEVNQNTMRAEYLVNTDQLDNFKCFMLGGAVKYFDTTSGTSKLSRLPPQELATYGGGTYTNFIAIKFEDTQGHQFTTDDNFNGYPIPEYSKQRVRVLYQQVPFCVANDNDVTNETERYLQPLPTNSQVDYLSLPGGIAKYVLYPGQSLVQFPFRVPVPYEVGFPTSLSTVSRKWIRLPLACWGPGSDLYATIYGDEPSQTPGLIGTVNQFEFLGFPQGTLLMLAPEEEITLDPVSGQAWNLTYKWLFKNAGHNYQYASPGGGAVGYGAGWYLVRCDGSDAYLDSGSPITQQQCFFANSSMMNAFQV